MTPRQKLLEKYVTFKQRMHRRATAKRTSHIRSAKGFSTPHRRSKIGLVKKLNRAARMTVMKRMFPGSEERYKEMGPYAQAAVQAMLDKRRASIRNISKKIRSQKRGKRSDLRRLSRSHYNKYSVDRTGGFGSTET